MRTRRRPTAADRGSSAAWVWWDARRAHRQGLEEIRRRQKERLAELVAYARAHSLYTGKSTGGCPSTSTTSRHCR